MALSWYEVFACPAAENSCKKYLRQLRRAGKRDNAWIRCCLRFYAALQDSVRSYESGDMTVARNVTRVAAEESRMRGERSSTYSGDGRERHGSITAKNRTAKSSSCLRATRRWQDTLAEWLRRWPAKPLGSARAGSNPAGVDYFFAVFFCVTLSIEHL